MAGACSAGPAIAPPVRTVSAAVTSTPPASADVAPNQREAWSGVFIGGQPDEAQLREAARQGFAAVVRLRAESEPMAERESSVVHALGIRYYVLPITSTSHLTEDRAHDLAAVLEGNHGPVLVHCATGNRAAALFTVERYLISGFRPESALMIGLRSGLTHWEPAVRERLGLGPQAAPTYADARD